MNNHLFLLSLLSLIILNSCSGKVKLRTEKDDTHKFIPNTRVYISPIDYGLYKKARSYKGFQEFDGAWKIQIIDATKNLAILDKTYNEDNLMASIKAEFIERSKITHPNGYKGFYVNYRQPNKRQIIHIVIVEVDSDIFIVKGTYSEQFPVHINELVKESIQNVYIGSVEEARKDQLISETTLNKEINIFNPAVLDFKFAGELEGLYYFTKDEEYPTHSPDSAWIAFKPVFKWGTSRSYWRTSTFEELLGSDYKIILTDERGPNDIAWLAQNADSTKIALAAFVWGNQVNVIKGAFQDNFKENTSSFIRMAMKTRHK